MSKGLGTVCVSGVAFTLREFLERYTPCVLGCGCEPGYRLCPEAQSLWQKVNAAYASFCRGRSDENWSKYQSALRDYHHHFKKHQED